VNEIKNPINIAGTIHNASMSQIDVVKNPKYTTAAKKAAQRAATTDHTFDIVSITLS